MGILIVYKIVHLLGNVDRTIQDNIYHINWHLLSAVVVMETNLDDIKWGLDVFPVMTI